MKRTLILLTIVALVSAKSFAQDNYKNYTYFLYTIAKNVQWPAEQSTGDFTIGVYGDTDLTPHLQSMASTKKISGRNIKIVKFNTISEIKGVNMLFVPENKSNELHQFVNKTTNASTLVVTEKPGMGKRGSGVNFVTNNTGKLGFELNTAALKSANLKISSDLVRFAEVL